MSHTTDAGTRHEGQGSLRITGLTTTCVTLLRTRWQHLPSVRGVGIAAGLAVWLGAAPLWAQGTDEFGPYGGLEAREHYESPQHYAFELRLGPYRPGVDDEFSGATPYADTFGKKRRYLLGIEWDWQALRIPRFGTFGPGFGIGYTVAKAKAPFTADPTSRSSEKTTLKVMPVYAVGVLRVDVLAEETKVPLAAYAKGGLGGALWWAVGEEKLERANRTVGKGSSYGYNFAVGGMFLLDSVDRKGAIEADSSTGINNAYAFLEYYRSSLDGFGSGRLQVGTETWMTGLALEF